MRWWLLSDVCQHLEHAQDHKLPTMCADKCSRWLLQFPSLVKLSIIACDSSESGRKLYNFVDVNAMFTIKKS